MKILSTNMFISKIKIFRKIGLLLTIDHESTTILSLVYAKLASSPLVYQTDFSSFKYLTRRKLSKRLNKRQGE
ncbi:hypothetical protein SAMN05421827_102351, partial [Pedobacter terrae]